jgi:hypothetical protein
LLEIKLPACFFVNRNPTTALDFRGLFALCHIYP